MYSLSSLRRRNALLRAPGEICVPAESHYIGEQQPMVHWHERKVHGLREGPHLNEVNEYREHFTTNFSIMNEHL